MELTDVTPEAVQALAGARLALRRMGTEPMDRPSALYARYAHELATALAALDNAGVFAALDEAVQSDTAEAILTESALDDVRKAREALVDEGIRTGYAAVSRLGKLERVPGTDTLRPVHEHIFRSPHSDEICYGAEWCTVTYREHRAQTAASRPTSALLSPRIVSELDAADRAAEGRLGRKALGLPEPEEVSDEWAARARAIESIRPTGRRSHGSLAADND